jgi:receptor protein-tyrosine kinase
MSIIEQAAKRLEELRRSGVDVPWAAAGLSEAKFDAMVGHPGAAASKASAPSSAPGSEPSGVQPTGLPAAAVAALHARGPAVPTAPRQARTVTIELDRLAAQGYLVPDLVRSDLALEFRHIKRPLLRNVAAGEPGKRRESLIMITSAMPNEGKTFCALNLAMSMAMEIDTSVMLVDADVVRPAVLDRVGLPPERGLLDLLTDSQLDVADVLLRTNVPKLSILPSGTRSAMATELLASAAMDRLLTELALRYPDRVIILDAPPLLPTTESRVLASRVGQVVVVVDAYRTTTTMVQQAFAAVETCPNVMSILNKCTQSEHPHSYYYDAAP